MNDTLRNRVRILAAVWAVALGLAVAAGAMLVAALISFDHHNTSRGITLLMGAVGLGAILVPVSAFIDQFESYTLRMEEQDEQ